MLCFSHDACTALRVQKERLFSWSVRVRTKRIFHCGINTQTILKFPDMLIDKGCLSCSLQEIQRIASLHLAETLRRQRSPMTARSTSSSRASCRCPCSLASVVTVAAGGETPPYHVQVAAVRATVAACRRHSALCFSHDVICEVKKVFIVILIPKPSLNFRTS